MPAPKTALLPESVELETVTVPLVLLMPPPKFPELPERVELETVTVPPVLLMPPQKFAELPERVELETVRVPKLLKAPPLPEALFAPETVTPEMVKSPPLSMVKILKLPLLASMVSEEAPRPLMVKVPAVLASTMFGNAAAKVMV